MFNVYLRKASEIYGVTRTRQIYQKAIELLDDKEARDMCMRSGIHCAFFISFIL